MLRSAVAEGTGFAGNNGDVLLAVGLDGAIGAVSVGT